ncbi:MAG: hypothetical protein K2L93_06740 [Muribaculaceae bacterium]|nr:hypothetical protein [Muribaculaceae bacterium]
MHRLIRHLRTSTSFIAIAITALVVGGCDHLDNNRIPVVDVRVPFTTIGDWETYGVSGAYQYRYFIKGERIPSGYPYTQLTFTGFGGVLLCADYMGNPVAYDLACPVECKNNVRIQVDPQTHIARCPVCGSEYEVCTLNYGYPISGPAADYGYRLAVYNVTPGPAGEYRVIRNPQFR